MPGLSPSRVLGPGGATGPGELEESSRGSEPLVLVADDEATVRELICEVLAPSGYRTLSASNGREASTSRPDTTPSLIVVDVMMPAMDGYATVARLRDDPETARIPVTIITGQASPTYRPLSEGVGARAHLTKPCSPVRLADTVRRVLTGQPG